MVGKIVKGADPRHFYGASSLQNRDRAPPLSAISWEAVVASRMLTRCYVHIVPRAQLSYWVWGQFPLSLYNPLSATSASAVLSGLRNSLLLLLFHLLLLLPPPPLFLSLSIYLSLFPLIFVVLHVPHRDHPSFLHFIVEFDRLSFSASFSSGPLLCLSLSLLFLFSFLLSLVSLLPIVDRLPA